MTQIETKILVIGMQGSGKSLLLKRLQYLSSNGLDSKFDEIPSTVATVGSNLFRMSFEKLQYEFREIGGAMAPIWKNYLKESDAIIYVIDKANHFQISASCMMLYTILSNELVEEKEVLVLFNKTDFPSSLSLQELLKIYRFKELRSQTKLKLNIIECCCVKKSGFEDIISWLVKIPK